MAGPGVIFTGFQFGESYEELRSNCFIYVQSTEVGGTHPALVEGMTYGNCIIANDVPEHREVLADCGLYYPKNDFDALSKVLESLSSDLSKVQEYGRRAKEFAAKHYDWNSICEQYETLFSSKASAAPKTSVITMS